MLVTLNFVTRNFVIILVNYTVKLTLDLIIMKELKIKTLFFILLTIEIYLGQIRSVLKGWLQLCSYLRRAATVVNIFNGVISHFL